jgi:hypothetical protein
MPPEKEGQRAVSELGRSGLGPDARQHDDAAQARMIVLEL